MGSSMLCGSSSPDKAHSYMKSFSVIRCSVPLGCAARVNLLCHGLYVIPRIYIYIYIHNYDIALVLKICRNLLSTVLGFSSAWRVVRSRGRECTASGVVQPTSAARACPETKPAKVPVLRQASDCGFMQRMRRACGSAI